MKHITYTLTLLSLIGLLTGCAKREEIPKQATYTFTNQTGKRVTFDLYDTKDDYNRSINRMQQYTLEPGGEQKITFDIARKYWIDWYSDGYSFNNWQSIRSNYNRTATPAPEFSIAAMDDQVFVKQASHDTTRSVLINGNGTPSIWRANATGNPSVNGTHQFKFMKDFMGEYTYTDVNGTINTMPIEYYIASTTVGIAVQQRFVLNVLNSPASSTLFQITCTPGNLLSPHTGRDTMMLRFIQLGSVPEIPLVRQ